ncbi:MAG: HlyD family efflux transporter periplasmic adaptor subunit [Fuerstiella sp.]|nr:HlyD family efflux transporter periplasmic adaptor subunit [Fuerstiella sp.]MCP4506030.1 HlyD family efflux transporter periplasmic adaptor subunit [Fuerstiella sp.]
MSITDQFVALRCRNVVRRRFAFFVGASALTLSCVLLLTGAVDRSIGPVEVGLMQLESSVFNAEIEQQGVIEPYQSTEVHSDCYWTTTILSMVPEGTWVQKGDVVCVFDSSDVEDYARSREILLIKYRGRLDNALHDQQMLKTTNERRLEAAEFAVETNTQNLLEYTEYTFPQQLQKMEQDLSMLSQEMQLCNDSVQQTEKLWVMGLVARQTMQSEAFELLEKKQKYNELDASLRFLTGFTHERSKLRLEYQKRDAERDLIRTKIKNGFYTTKATLTTLSYERTLRIYERYHRRAMDSIKGCTLRAPCDGQVVYGNSWYLKSRGITQVEEGGRVRYRQKIFEIPDHGRYKVSVPLMESLIYKVREGMPVTVQLPAYDDVEIAGKISLISRYPRVRSRYTPGLKDYWIDVELLPTAEQRDLLTHKADVVVNFVLAETENVLQIPRKAVTGIAGHNFVYVFNGRELVPRKVELGEANDLSVCVETGLSVGEKLVTEMTPQHELALRGTLTRDLIESE